MAPEQKQVPDHTPPPPMARGHALLNAYFRSEVTLGDKSPIGAVLERAALFADHFHWDWDRQEFGVRVSVMKRSCRRCRGTGLDLKKLEQWKANKLKFEAVFGSGYEDFCQKAKCRRCKGKSEVAGKTQESEITMQRRPGASNGMVEMREPSDAAVLKLARSSRVMLAVGRRNRRHQLALLVYHGAPGDHCQGKHGNRLTSLIPLVWRSATALLEEHGVIETYRRLTENSRALDERRWSFRRGEAKAHQLLCDATETWNLAYDELHDKRRAQAIEIVQACPELTDDVDVVPGRPDESAVITFTERAQ